jgi:hypothetical protein
MDREQGPLVAHAHRPGAYLTTSSITAAQHLCRCLLADTYTAAPDARDQGNPNPGLATHRGRTDFSTTTAQRRDK